MNHDYKWVKTSGIISPDKWGNLPGGEVFTTPGEVNGTYVVDGVVGDYLCEKYQDLGNQPLTIHMKKNRITEVFSENKELEQEFWAYTHTDENSDLVGEFAIGTNLGAKARYRADSPGRKVSRSCTSRSAILTDSTPARTGTPARTSTWWVRISISGLTGSRSCKKANSSSRHKDDSRAARGVQPEFHTPRNTRTFSSHSTEFRRRKSSTAFPKRHASFPSHWSIRCRTTGATSFFSS